MSGTKPDGNAPVDPPIGDGDGSAHSESLGVGLRSASVDFDPEREALQREIGELQHGLLSAMEKLEPVLRLRGPAGGLESVHREIQASNEQLQLNNEQLQASREIMDSVRELLRSANEQMQQRGELLKRLNDDVTNLLNHVERPLVVLGADAAVRHYTPEAAAILGLTAGSIGRAFPRLKLKLEMGDLEESLRDVMAHGQTREIWARTADGQRLSLRLAAYRTIDRRIDGVVLRVLDRDVASPSGATLAAAAARGVGRK
ncbi:MAG: PAS domain-containing protein [Acidobacteriota bacterium]